MVGKKGPGLGPPERRGARSTGLAPPHGVAARRPDRGGFVPITPTTDRGLWHPRCRDFHDYVQSITPQAAPAGRLPSRAQFDPTRIPALLPQLWIVEVEHDPIRLRIRLVGTKVVDALRKDATGQYLDDAFPQARPEEYFDRYLFMILEKTGTWRRGASLVDHGPAWSEVENVIMPFASDGDTVDRLYGYSVYYRASGEEW
jgi:hypothetical protein